jgi:hypothetical protein
MQKYFTEQVLTKIKKLSVTVTELEPKFLYYPHTEIKQTEITIENDEIKKIIPLCNFCKTITYSDINHYTRKELRCNCDKTYDPEVCYEDYEKILLEGFIPVYLVKNVNMENIFYPICEKIIDCDDRFDRLSYTLAQIKKNKDFEKCLKLVYIPESFKYIIIPKINKHAYHEEDTYYEELGLLESYKENGW